MSTEYHKFKRFNVVGTSGTGKTTFSSQLSKILAIPHIEIDAIYWGPNWYEPSDEEFFPKLKAALRVESWILDGNYTRSIPIKWARIDCVIWLDYSFLRTLYQAVRRALHRSFTGRELWEGTGNRESFRQSFLSRESIILWTIKTYAKNRRQYAAMMEDQKYAHVKFVRLSSPGQAEAFLKRLQNKSLPINSKRERFRC